MILAGVPLEREIGTLFLELQGVQIAFARLFFPFFSVWIISRIWGWFLAS